jgi:hypothetical protein
MTTGEYTDMEFDASSAAAIALSQCALGLPLMLVWIAAGVLIALRIDNHRNAALVALAGIVLGALELVGGTFANASAPLLIRRHGVTPQDIGTVYTVIRYVQPTLSSISWGLVLAGLVMALGKRDHPGGA